MATLSIDIPDAQATRVRDGYAARHGWTGTHNGSPESKAQFLKRKVMEHIKGSVLEAEESAGKAAAVEAARQSVEAGVTLT